MTFPEDLKYSKEHEWVRVSGNIVTVGVTDYAQDQLGEIVFVELPDEGEEFGKDDEGKARMITVLRPDGTSLYTTQDLGLAVRRVEEYSLDRLVYIVGSEQRFHFQSLFAMLKALGYEWAQKLYHLWYGMVYLPDGKMKSREGTVVDADDLVGQMVELAKQEVELRIKNKELRMDSGLPDEALAKSGMTQEELERRATAIALAAIKFYMLRSKPTTDIHFDPNESISFEGFTGPYCLYTYARCRSILVKSKIQISNVKLDAIDYSVLGNEDERQLLLQLENFPEVIQKSSEHYDPSQLATFVFKTAQVFNQFYGSSPVLKAEAELQTARLQLVESTAQVLQSGLHLLGMETLEEM